MESRHQKDGPSLSVSELAPWLELVLEQLFAFKHISAFSNFLNKYILHWNCFIICGLTLFEADTSAERTVTSLAEPLWAKVGLPVPDRNQLEAGLSREGRGERRRLFEKDKSPNSQERRWSGGGWKEGRKAGWETDALSKPAGRRRDEEKG